MLASKKTWYPTMKLAGGLRKKIVKKEFLAAKCHILLHAVFLRPREPSVAGVAESDIPRAGGWQFPKKSGVQASGERPDYDPTISRAF